MPPSPAGAAKPDKTMSSRLLTMKFMQRAAASQVAKEAAKEAEQPKTDENDDEQTENQKEHTPKRARKSMDRRTGASGAQADLDAMSAAIAEEEQKRREAASAKASAAGESQWSFNYPAAAAPSPRFVMATESLDDIDNASAGRRGFGGFVRKKQTADMTEQELQEAKLARITSEVDALVMEGSIPKKAREKQIWSRMRGTHSAKGITSISGAGGGGGGGRDAMNRKKRKSGD